MKCNTYMKLFVAVVIVGCEMLVTLSSKSTELTVAQSDEDEHENPGYTVVQESFIDPNAAEFIPTHEWQDVKKGQAIPSGLHVRLNLATGKREAKLLEPDDNENVKKIESEYNDPEEVETNVNMKESRLKIMKSAMEDAMNELKEADKNEEETNKDKNDEVKYWKSGEKQGMVNLGKDHFTKDELKDALKKFKASKDDVQDSKIKEESVKNKYRSMEELKNDFEKLNVGMKTDLEILQELHNEYMKEDTTLEKKLTILEDIEYYVHQIDNAVQFVDIGTMQLVIKDLNHTNEMVRSAAAFALGSAVQSNPKVQVGAIEGGALHHLIRMLSTESATNVHNRVIYAMSSLIRNFPFAQMKFLEQGGLQVLGEIFTKSQNERLKIKVVTLLGDLVHEHNSMETKKTKMKDEEYQEKIRQYSRIPLFEFITEHGWCNLVPTLLTLQDHDQREKTLISMKELLPICKQYYNTFENQLLVLKTEYTTLAQIERKEKSGDIYFSTVAETISVILKEMSVKDEL